MFLNKEEICGVNTSELPLLSDEEKNRVCGLIINKFRGVKTILDP